MIAGVAVALALATLVSTSMAGFDVDAVGLSALERSAIVERARSELGAAHVELVDAPGLAQCSADSPEANAGGAAASASTSHIDCARTALEGAGAIAGAAVRVVKVLQVVRVELTVLDRDGKAVATSLRTLDVEGAATGPLFDDAARVALAQLAPLAPRSSGQTSPGPGPGPGSGDGSGAVDVDVHRGAPATQPATSAEAMPLAAVGAGLAGAALAVVGGALAANEALLANSPASSGDEKERARILGPVATGVAIVGVAVAIGGPVALTMLQ